MRAELIATTAMMTTTLSSIPWFSPPPPPPLTLTFFLRSLYPSLAQLTQSAGDDDYKWDFSHMAGAGTKP